MRSGSARRSTVHPGRSEWAKTPGKSHCLAKLSPPPGISRTNDLGAAAVATAITSTLAIDPMLAAEMIRRSASAVWDLIKDDILAFVDR